MANSKRPITANDFKKLAVYSDPQFTPDGSGYAFVSTTVTDNNDYASQIFVQELSTNKLKQWTYGDDKNSNPRFSPDGKKVVFQSNRSGVPQLWLLHTDGGEAKQITTFKNGAINPEWSKNGRTIIFTASLDSDDDVKSQKEQSKEERKKEREEKNKQPLIVTSLRYKSDAKGFHDDKKSQIILYDVEGETFTQLTTEDSHHGYQDISPDGTNVLFAGNLNEDAEYELTNDLYTVNVTTKEVTKLTNGNGSYHSASYSPSGDKIAFFGHEQTHAGATLNELYILDVESRERTCLSGEWDFQLGDLMIGDTRLGSSTTGPVWSKNEDKLFFIGTDHGATGLYQVNLQGELKVLYKNDNHVFGFTYDENTESFVIGVSTPTNPCNYYLLDHESNLSRLTNANTKFLEEVELSEPETITYQANDGWDIQGWLLRPYGFEEGKKYPFVLEIHGGPHAMYGQTFFHEMQLLAAKGYVVLYTNPRGSHGYGQEFVDACRADYGGNDYTDLMSAVDYALENYSFIDEDRLGVTGGSYGGFMTNWIVGHTNRFKAAVTQRSISNWLSFYGVSDIGYFFTKWELGHNLLDDTTKLWEFSPLKYAEKVETPLLILHGEQDYRCPIEQGEQLFVALKHLRKEVEFVRFPGASHELSRSGKPEMRIERLNHICRWFEKYL
ncbi:prolyl oligopeptidase family serine peptidase [Ornithinibacillus sp. L9]|uniref:Prolyl oligopeptidase family serine peptidase n=1 Tax=Ornithinibacillus caprae TaxID=2678566 RepID=A0A6N8FGN0_9BACI|nr:S9 family peptidase [Ornithinibacillus caprae]MUK88812.1 prolyl oligopeptidase family serine peptidase [Ornithinibacillus caprae]